MIKNRASYDFVNIPATMIIDGGIMPLRANQDLLRGEDPCFLTEAWKERDFAIYGSYVSNSVYIMDFSIKADRLFTAENWFHQICNYQAGFPRATTGTPQSSYRVDVSNSKFRHSLAPCELDENLMMAKTALVGDPYNFVRGNPLNKYHVQQCFTDVNTVVQFQMQPNDDEQYFAAQLEYDETKSGDHDESSDALEHEVLFWNGSQKYTSSFTRELKSGTFKTYLGQQRMKYIDSATQWLALDVFIARNSSDDTTGTPILTQQFTTLFFPIEGVKTTDGFIMPLADVKQCIASTKTALDMVFDPYTNGKIYRARISAYCRWLTINMNNRTKW